MIIMTRRRVLQLLILLLLFTRGMSQNTIGLISLNNEIYSEGYNLLFPHNQSDVFLINSCGQIVNIWEDEGFVPGNSVYLTEDGNLVKCKRRTTSSVNDPIWAGGGGEFIEIRSWTNDSIATFKLNDSLFRLHHDIAVMDNGNILMISWEAKNLEESLMAGRDPDKLSQDKIWSEAIFEWNPFIDSIVWEWHAWDHLIQDLDDTKRNFGVIEDHPELINLNYDEHAGHPDWLHMNAIDYNEELDQIIMSIPYFNEFWIIDHSTTTTEAASHKGGRSDMGGDLICRWGNPQTYNRGSENDQRLFFQHDVHWVDPISGLGAKNFSKIALYNNRVGEELSTVNSLILPWNPQENRYEMSGETFGPTAFDRTVVHPFDEPRSISSSLSSAQLLPNDNFLICAGRWGYNYEVTPAGELAWEYITPIVRGQRGMQGDTSLTINANLTFRIKRYPKDFPGIVDDEIMPLSYIETSPDTSFCGELTTSVFESEILKFEVYPNPTSDYLTIKSEDSNIEYFEIISLNGHVIRRFPKLKISSRLVISDLMPGLYFIRSSLNQFVEFTKI